MSEKNKFLSPQKIEQIYNNYKNGKVGITQIHYYYKDKQLQETAEYIKKLEKKLEQSKEMKTKLNIDKKNMKGKNV